MSTVAIIGAAGGIGRVLVDELSANGSNVIALDLPTSLRAHPLKCTSIPIDILDTESIDLATNIVRSMNLELDGLVNLAGYTKGVRPLVEMDLATFDDTIMGNLRGVFTSTRELLPLMAQNGSIVTVASGLAQSIRPGHGAYAMAKAGIIAMTKTLAIEESPRLRVNAVAPGPVQTAFLTGGTGVSTEDQACIIDVEKLASATPLGRIAIPTDVTGPIRFLLSDQSGFMTGQVLWINGGAYMP